jgi:nucleotide-binding universal stress UspA family protein
MGPVLLCYDGSDDADRSVRRAATLLRPQDAVVLDLARRPFAAAVAASGRRVALDAGFDPVTVADARHGPIATAVLEHAHRAGASVVVVGSDGRSRSPSAMFGGISSVLLRRSDIPVLVVPPGMTASPADEPILVGYDGSPAARQALATAAGLLAGRVAIVAAFMPAVDDVAVLRSALPWPVAGAVQDGLARLDREDAEAPAQRAVEGARAAAALGFVPRPVGIPGIDASSEEEEEPFRRLLRAPRPTRPRASSSGTDLPQRLSTAPLMASSSMRIVPCWWYRERHEAERRHTFAGSPARRRTARRNLDSGLSSRRSHPLTTHQRDMTGNVVLALPRAS